MAFIEIDSLTKTYGRLAALDRITLQIEKGEWVSIMGPSGSGKTTLLNLLGGLDRPSSGSVSINGSVITGMTLNELTQFRREHIGLVFQQFFMIPYLTALENVMIAQYYHSMADEDEAATALEKVGLGDRLHHLPSELSGGEKQRVCIARALINDAEIILADEPTGNLDADNETIVMNLFRRMHAEGHTLVLVTHDSTIGWKANRIATLEHGRLIKIDSGSSTRQEESSEIVLEGIDRSESLSL
ncbi:putative ABC transporter ATP-binding protein/MT1014 [bacterium BMS3Abin05]|nr:putative ABC transporter ATP-binding protein/MT1014 [bacterium BMS3Abin05]GBE28771.1 putative ABC transporter ATP-binding protein/MT1014 [bacterium BMS3Bbin03]